LQPNMTALDKKEKILLTFITDDILENILH
jgi:hypothetical protein